MASKTASQIGTVAISTAAMPDGMSSSAEHDAAVAAEEEQRADDEGGAPVRAGRPLERLRAAPQAGVGDERAEHEQPGGAVPDAGRQQRRQRLDHDRDAEVRRTPHHVDDERGRRRPAAVDGGRAPGEVTAPL